MYAVAILLTLALSGHGQVSPEEHAKHHPGKDKEKDKGGQDKAKDKVGMSGMAPGGKEGAGMGMMGGGMDMEKMMADMAKAPPKELYPTLMNFPDLTPEQWVEVQGKAQDRMRSGVALVSKGLDRLSKAAENEDYLAMQEATGEVREGLAQFESGLAARRALAEGKPPRQVALQWFKGEMNLQPPLGVEARAGLFGLTAFHLFTMVLLIAFALAMVAMYFFKMRRAAALFERIETDSGRPPPGSAPPLAGAPGPSATVTPSVGKAPPAGGAPPPAAPADKSAVAAPAAPPAADDKAAPARGTA